MCVTNLTITKTVKNTTNDSVLADVKLSQIIILCQG